ncbi:hypothetical protein BDN70DRAFT_992683 [Pholiota conissans]|uniref:Uncharacterized protein n=1 Tax=Pholiota conissans TaxID=109636 RepID=A0A9P5Z6Q4_9AGAR|nr:hypothetical protein BDN70DRAFT_992683 [Pholiota conissans]
MSWYSVVYSHFVVFFVSVRLIAAQLFHRNTPSPLIALPVTSPLPSKSYIIIACQYIQRFIIAPVTAINFCNLLRQINYTLVWKIPMYMRQIANALRCIRVTVVKFFASGLLCLATVIQDSTKHPRWTSKKKPTESTVLIHIRESRSIDPPRLSAQVWQSYQTYSANSGFGYAAVPSNISVLTLDPLNTPISESSLNWGLSPTQSYLGTESSSVESQSSLVTPSQSPNQAFFNGLSFSSKNIYDCTMDITESLPEHTHSLAERLKLKQLSTKLYPMGMNPSTTSINSFGQIERLFENNYGKAASLAADEFFTSLGKQGIQVAPPAPVTIFSARVSYDTSPSRSALNMRLNALVSGNNSANSSFSTDHSTRQENTVVEEDITAAVIDVGNRLLDLSMSSSADSFVLHDISSPESDKSSVEFILSPQENLLEDDASFNLAYRDSFSRSSAVFSPPDSLFSQYSQDSTLEASSVPSSSSVSSPFYDTMTPAIPGIESPLNDNHPTFHQNPSLSEKKLNRRARITSGLAIDVKALSPTIISSVDLASPVVPANSELGPTYSDISIPSIVVSPVSEDSTSLASSPPDLSNGVIFPGQKNRLSDLETSSRAVNVEWSLPVVEYILPARIPQRAQSASIGVSGSPSRTAARETNSRRVGLRGSVPRYRFSTLPELCQDREKAAVPSSDDGTNDRRVGLLGAAPRQRFAATLSPPSLSHSPVSAARAAHEARSRAAVLDRHRARTQFFAQRDGAHGSGLRPLLLPMSVEARERGSSMSGRSVSPTRFWGMPFY